MRASPDDAKLVRMDSTHLSWVQWLAQDADGTWWGYSAMPNEADHGWYENEVGDCIRLRADAPNPDWRGTLRRAG